MTNLPACLKALPCAMRARFCRRTECFGIPPERLMKAVCPASRTSFDTHCSSAPEAGGWTPTSAASVPFKIDRDELYLREETQSGKFFVASCIFRAPSASVVLQYCLEAFSRKDVTKVIHGETGPALLTDAIRQSGRQAAVQPGDQFLPVPWWSTNGFSSMQNFQSMAVARSTFGTPC